MKWGVGNLLEVRILVLEKTTCFLLQAKLVFFFDNIRTIMLSTISKLLVFIFYHFFSLLVVLCGKLSLLNKKTMLKFHIHLAISAFSQRRSYPCLFLHFGWFSFELKLRKKGEKVWCLKLKTLEFNDRGDEEVGIKLSWVEKNSKFNK